MTLTKRSLTLSQRAALTHPCETAEEMADPRYRWMVRRGWSLVLTVNVGQECFERFNGRPVWHVSVARHTDTGPQPLGTWSTALHSQADRFLAKALRGVGGDRIYREYGEIAQHLRRELTKDEAAIARAARPGAAVFSGKDTKAPSPRPLAPEGPE